MNKIGFIGTGNMSTALLCAAAASGAYTYFLSNKMENGAFCDSVMNAVIVACEKTLKL